MKKADTNNTKAFDLGTRSSKVGLFSKVAGWFGIALAAPVLVWFLVGFIPGVPSMVAVFGVPGLRVPASVFVAGLLIAAVGFREF